MPAVLESLDQLVETAAQCASSRGAAKQAAKTTWKQLVETCARFSLCGRSAGLAAEETLATRDRAGFLCGCMNLGGNIAGITVPIIVGFIVQITGSYLLAMMFFAGPCIALLICSSAIDYSRKLPV